MTDPNALTPQIRAEYWSLVDKSGPGAEARMAEIFGKRLLFSRWYMTVIFSMMHLMVAAHTGKPFGSAARQADENRLVADGTKSTRRS